MSLYYQPAVLTVNPVVVPQPVVHVTTTVPIAVYSFQPAVFTAAAQPPAPSVQYIQVSPPTTTATPDTNTNLPVPSHRRTLRLVFYGHHSVTSDSATSPPRRQIWRRALDTSFTERPTLASFKERIPRVASQVGVPSNLTWRTASIFVMYPHSRGVVDIAEGIGPVQNEDVIQELIMVNSEGRGASASGSANARAVVGQEEWDIEMGRWEAGQVVLYGVVCMDEEGG
ncbi:hypothetical protein E4U55_007686 [Claviceps digitariae]|nr:hypothetical protein E4U55_007686 [Claviceps digitariae]